MTIDKLIALTEGIATKADKMRVLERNGYARADIARFLGVRYQQVRNTLEGDKRTGYNPQISASSFLASANGSTDFRVISIGEDGSAQIDPDMLEQFDVDGGSVLVALDVSGGIFISTWAGMASRARAAV